MKQRKDKSGSEGFSLIELMVVMLILGILAGIVVPKFLDEPEKARRIEATTDIKAIDSALKMYKLQNGQYPTTEQGLQALVEPPSVGKLPKNWQKGGYLEKLPKDPWDNDYIYISPGLHGDFDLMTYARDGEPGGEELDADINNWDEK